MGRGELLLWGCSQITNADACLLSTQNTLRFSVLYICMLTCWQTNHTSKINTSSPERFLTKQCHCVNAGGQFCTRILCGTLQREKICLWTQPVKKHFANAPNFKDIYFIYVSENINLRIKHADKTCPAQVIWAGNQYTLPHGKIHAWISGWVISLWSLVSDGLKTIRFLNKTTVQMTYIKW